MTLQTDKTSLEIQTALLAGKQILLKYNNQIIGKIIGEYISFYNEQNGYGINYFFNPSINFLSFFYNSFLYSNNFYSTLVEAKASTDPVYLQFNGQTNNPIITDDPIINDPGSSR